MIGIVIAAHGSLAATLLSTVELIIGKQEQVTTVSFEPGQSVADLQTRIATAVEEVDKGKGVLILSDILGGSPYNASVMLMMKQSKMEVIAGVSLPMLFAVLSVRKGKLEKVAERALVGGHNGIVRFEMNKK